MVHGRITHKEEAVMKRENQYSADFRKRIRRHILCLLQKSPLGFEQILRRSLNCDPALLLDTLNKLHRSKIISTIESRDLPLKYQLKVQKGPRNRGPLLCHKNASLAPNNTWSLAQTKDLRNIVCDIQNSLPEPSPVYYQWWFSTSAYENLIRLLFSLTKSRAPISFIGSGTLGAAFSHFSTNHVTIFDIDESFLKSLNSHCIKITSLVHYDVSQEPAQTWKNTFQLVFVDPPWSSSLLRTFLIRGTSFVRDGGKLVISFPQLLTRPSIPREQENLIELASTLGLSLELVLPGFTKYSVPLFEYNAYKHYGIELKKPWRRGDLLIFRKIGDAKTICSDLIEETPIWEQYQRGKSRIFLKRDGRCEEGPPLIKPLSGLENLMYKSTSSRLPFWKSVSLVSSRNCVACAYGRKKLSILLRDILNGTSKFNRGDQSVSTPRSEEIKSIILSMLNGGNLVIK
jgi:predicted methyltransferase